MKWEREKLAAMIAAGKTTRQIADTWEVTEENVRVHACNWNLPLNRVRAKYDERAIGRILRLRDQGVALKLIAQQFDTTANAISKAIYDHRRRRKAVAVSS